MLTYLLPDGAYREIAEFDSFCVKLTVEVSFPRLIISTLHQLHSLLDINCGDVRRVAYPFRRNEKEA